MKASELRIGNLVLDGKNKIIEVDSISELGINIEHGSLTLFFEPFNSFGITDNNDVIKPIPLTKEWLEKNGFERKGLNGYLTIFTPCGKGLVFKDNYFIFAGVTIETPINYVHQLQNLYFSLTGEEL